MKEATLVGRVIKPAIFLTALVPAALLIQRAVAGTLSANPIEDITHETGVWALRLLLVTLTITPLRRLTGWNSLIRFRRMVGLFAFFYACLHLTTYVVLDHFFNWDEIIADVYKRPYITAGTVAFTLLVPLALTSTTGMIRRLGGRRWQALHRLAYVSAAAAVVHYLWLVKADQQRPIIYGTILAILLLLRLWWARGATRLSPTARSRASLPPDPVPRSTLGARPER